MANGIELIVDVSVSATAGNLEQQDLDTALLLGTSERDGTDLVRYYNQTNDVVADYDEDTAEYKAAERFFSQNPRPARLAIGKRTRLPTQRFTFTPVLANSTLYSWEVDGVVIEYTSDANATLAEITAGLVAAWTAAETALGVDAPDVVVTDVTGTSVRQTAGAAGVWTAVKVLTPKVLRVVQDHVDAGVAADLGDMLEEQPDWYGILTLFPSQAEVLAIAQWAQANNRLFFYATTDSALRLAPYDAGTADSTVGGALRSRSLSNVFGVYQGSTGDFADAAFLSYFLAKPPGSVTMHLKKAVGVPAVALTSTERTNVQSYNVNPYITISNLSKLLHGKVAAGEFVDIIRDTHWDVVRTAERLFTVISDADKVPFTPAGVALLTAEVGGQTQVAEDAGVYKSGWTVSALAVDKVSQADRAARRFPNITKRAQYQGAIHFAGVVMNLSV